MQAAARIDSSLRWYRWPYVGGNRPTLTVQGRREAFEVNVLGALRAFAFLVRDVATHKQFLLEYGPLVEPVNGTVDVRATIREQRALAAVWRQWHELDAQTLEHWRNVSVDDLPTAAGKEHRKLLRAESLQRARQIYIAPQLSGAHLNTRLELDDEGLLLRPNDLRSAMWLTVVQRMTVGDASIRCRNADCTNLVWRSQADGDSMRATYCAETRDRCIKHVERWWARGRKEVDRYPHLRKLAGKRKLEAVHKLRSYEAL